MKFLNNHPKIKDLGLILIGVSIGFKLGLSADFIYNNYIKPEKACIHEFYNSYIKPAIEIYQVEDIEKQLSIW